MGSERIIRNLDWEMFQIHPDLEKNDFWKVMSQWQNRREELEEHAMSAMSHAFKAKIEKKLG
jgi:hypothetical protein